MVNGILRTLSAVACCVVVAGCCGFDPCNLDLCDIDLCDPCDDPCEPDPCDPCADGAPKAPPGMPEGVKPGEAWCRILIPAQYKDVEEQVCVCPATTRCEQIPAVFEERTRQVCVCPAKTKTIKIPGEYETQTEKVLVCAARTEWRKIPCTPSQLAAGEKQGDCWQLVEIPAQYKDVCKRVCVKEPSCKTETIPPVYKTVTEKVCVKPASTKQIPVPAKYETRTRKELVAPCRWEWRRNEDCEVPEAAPVAK